MDGLMERPSSIEIEGGEAFYRSIYLCATKREERIQITFVAVLWQEFFYFLGVTFTTCTKAVYDHCLVDS